MTDEKNVIYTAEENGVLNVWTMPIDGGAAKQLTRFSSQEIFSVAVSADGKQLAMSRGMTAADVILIKDFR